VAVGVRHGDNVAIMYPFTSARAARRRQRRKTTAVAADGGAVSRRRRGGPSDATRQSVTRAHERTRTADGARESTGVHAVAVATALAAGAPRRQLTRARPRMGGAWPRVRAQPARPGRARVAGGGGNATARVPRSPSPRVGSRSHRSRSLARAPYPHHRRAAALPERHLARAGSRSLRTSAADQSVYVLRAGRYVNG